jgi:opacity protein-like surface antigen
MMRSELRNRLATAVLSCGFLFPTIAGAVDIEIAPVLGYRLGGQFTDDTTGTHVDVEPAPSFGLAVDVEYAPDRMVEVFYTRQSTEIEDLSPALDMDVEYFQIGGVAEYSQENYTPYAVGTLGATRFSPDGNYDSETRFSLTFGGGVKWFLNDRWAVKAEGRAYLTIFDSEGDVFCVSSGGATCLFRVSGSVIWQLEANVGVAFRF